MAIALAPTLRLVVLILGALNVGAALAVLKVYFGAYRRSPRKGGLLPLHVVTIASGYILIQAPLVAAMADQAKEMTFSWRIPVYGAGQLLVLFALGVVARLQTRKIPDPRVTGEIPIQRDKAPRGGHHR